LSPLLHYHDGRILSNVVPYSLTSLDGVTRNPSLPSLSPEQEHALSTLQDVAARHCRPLAMKLGDLTYVNNFSVMHAREQFLDSPPDNVRYLVRMWLKNPRLALKLPPDLRVGNRRVYRDEDLGIEESWNIAFKPRVQFDIADRLSP
jgi:hypothetical protein